MFVGAYNRQRRQSFFLIRLARLPEAIDWLVLRCDDQNITVAVLVAELHSRTSSHMLSPPQRLKFFFISDGN